MIKNQNLFYRDSSRLRLVWRVLIFIPLLLIAVSPLLLIENSTLQFLGATVVLVLSLYLNSKYLDKRPFSEYGLIFTKASFLYFSVGALIGAVSVSLILLIGILTGALSASKYPTNPDLTLLLLFGLKMVFVAIIEESIYRGYFFTNLHAALKYNARLSKLALVIAVGTSSILFGLAHFWNDHASFISISLLTINGIVWCIPFIMTGNLGLSIGLHTSWNFSQSFWGFTMSGNKPVDSILDIKNTGDQIWTGGAYGPEAGLLGLLGFITMLFLTMGYLKTTAIPANRDYRIGG